MNLHFVSWNSTKSHPLPSCYCYFKGPIYPYYTFLIHFNYFFPMEPKILLDINT